MIYLRNIYLIVNNLVLNNIEYLNAETIDEKRSKRPLSIEGEKKSELLFGERFKDISSMYSSGFSSALSTAKYLSSYLNIPINIENKFNERKIGQINKTTNLNFFRENQEHDFDYKLPGGESFNDVKVRITKAFKEITKINQDEEIAIFTHNIAITALLSNWCEVDYNLDNRLILNFNERMIDLNDPIVLLKLAFDNNFKLTDVNVL